jgi:hypothetical protein
LQSALAIARETGDLADLVACADVRVVAYPDYFALLLRDDFTGGSAKTALPVIGIANLACAAQLASSPDLRAFLGARLIELLRSTG